MVRWVCLLGVALLALPLSVSGQGSATGNLPVTQGNVPDSLVRSLFDGGQPLLWVRRYRGRIDDAFLVEVVLGFDGAHCRGFCTYVKSKVRFILQGRLESDKVFLEERGKDNTVTGTFTGRLDSLGILLNWQNTTETISCSLEAYVSGGAVVTANCGDNKWAGRYISRYNNTRVDMVLIWSHHGSVDGFLWIEADKQTYRLRGTGDRALTFEVEALLSDGKTAGLLQGNLSNPGVVTCSWLGGGQKRSFVFNQKDKLLFGCLDFADFRSGFDAYYPKTACLSCNSWLDQQMIGWINQCKAKAAENKETSDADLRNKYRGSSWTEIVCWTDRLLCGYLTFTETWNTEAQGVAFNFDIKTGKLITLDDLFNTKSFDASAWMLDYSRRMLAGLPRYSRDPEFQAWIEKAGFPMFSIRREGIELSSYFHPQYGRQALLIPYVDLRDYLRKDGPLGELYKLN